MKGKIGWIIGIGLWMVSLLVVGGSLILSLSEGGLRNPNSQAEQARSATSEEQATATEARLEALPTATSTPLPTETIPITETAIPTCAYPAGWVMTTLPAETTLEELARQYGLTADELLQANCLSQETVGGMSALYLPAATLTPSPTATATEKPRKPKATATSGGAACAPPPHWVIYIVQKGDTLYSLSVQSGASISELQSANCLGNSTTVRVGQKLYLPKLPAAALPTPTAKQSKPTKPAVTSAPAVTPIVITPKATASP